MLLVKLVEMNGGKGWRGERREMGDGVLSRCEEARSVNE